MLKFNRKYLLAIQYGEYETKVKEKDESGKEVERVKYEEGSGELVIRPFFTIRLNIDRGIYSSVNKMTLDIINLGKTTREKIYYDGILHAAVKKKIVLYAGYSDADFSKFEGSVITKNIRRSINGLPLVFCGRFTRAYSYREGSDFITHIEAFDLPEKNEVKIDAEFQKGDNQDTFVNKFAELLNIDKKAVVVDKDFKFTFNRNKSFSKITAWEAMQNMIDSLNYEIKKQKGDNAPLFRVYFDYPNLIISKDNQYNEDWQSLITSDTGLLSTPIRESSKITFKTLFEPSFRCGGYVKLDSRTTQSGINGILQVVGFKHSGTISPVTSEKLTTDFTCFLGIDKLEPIRKS